VYLTFTISNSLITYTITEEKKCSNAIVLLKQSRKSLEQYLYIINNIERKLEVKIILTKYEYVIFHYHIFFSRIKQFKYFRFFAYHLLQ
jgi:hypothetical protein